MVKQAIPREPRHPDFLHKQIVKDDQNPTATSIEQHEVEVRVFRQFVRHREQLVDVGIEEGKVPTNIPELKREKMIKYLTKGLQNLPRETSQLDASRPWLCYWILHSLELLNYQIKKELKLQMISFLGRCQNPEGGFGGGPGQMSHLAPTYAAVNAIAILGEEEGYNMIDREAMVKWLNSLRQKDGSFIMHVDGEDDVRGVYCALSVAKLLNIYSKELFKDTDQWTLRCQTYEGGFGATPGTEAHGGYTFCGLASVIFMGVEKLCDIDLLLKWVVNRQMRMEGGFQGRTNKLVDSCYSMWQGGTFPLLHSILAEDGHLESLSRERWLFDQESLQEYLLICCQDSTNGLVDKPGKHSDYYHTCYALSGLSVAQHFNWNWEGVEANIRVLGNPENELLETHPLFNIGLDAAIKITSHFNKMSLLLPQ